MSINKSWQSPHRFAARSAGIIGFATFISRLLGFIRDLVIARLLGVYLYAQAFVIAFRIPNLLRDLLAEGAANAAFVPVFSEYALKHSKEELWDLVNVVLNLLLIALALITLLGVAFSPLIVRLIAPGFVASPEKLEITIRLTRVIFPYILLISLSAYATAILNSLKHFTVSAFAPCLLNISMIIFAVIFGEGIRGLALGILTGGILQIAVQIPLLYRNGLRLSFLRRLWHPQAAVIGRLMLPRILSSGIYQLNNFVDSVFGSLVWIVGDGAVAVLYFAYRLIQFPIGIFSNALAQAILPVFSVQAIEENRQGLIRTLSWGLRATFFLMLPVSAGFIALGKPIVSTLFQGGRFDINSVNLTAAALLFYSIGLFAYGATKVLQSCFFALKDTITPAKISAIALVMNIILNSLLMFPLKIAGLALATSVSAITAFIILLILLKRKLGNFNTREIVISFARILAASVLMGVVCHFISRYPVVVLNKYIQLGLLILSGFISYVVFCHILRVSEMQQLWNWLMQRFGFSATR